MQDTSSKQQTKQKYKPNHQRTGLPLHSTLPLIGKASKQTKTQHKSHPNTKLTQISGPTLGGPEPKGTKNSTLKPGKGSLKHNVKIKKMKRQRNTTQMKEKLETQKPK